jgi:hypothetical protein
MQYVCLRDCWGFRNTRWRQGEIVEVAEDEIAKIPHHFSPVGTVPEVKAVKPEEDKPIALSQLAQAAVPKGGLAASYEEHTPTLNPKTLQPKTLPDETKKRGRPKKGV